MRHKVAGHRLGRSTGQRTALRRNLMTEFFRHERIRTTRAKADAIRGETERHHLRQEGNARRISGAAPPPPHA
jgi:ribosomal protein L17